MLARFIHISRLIEEFGLYVTATGRRIIVVRAFVKKTQQTPAREIELALKRAQEVSQ